MKHSLYRVIALVLSLVLLLSCFAGCSTNPDPTESTKDTAGETKPKPSTPGIVTKPTEPPETLPAPVEQPVVTAYPEAMELTVYLKAFTAEDAAGYDKELTGAQAKTALNAVGLSQVTVDASAATVSGRAFLADVLTLLGYKLTDDAARDAQIAKIHLTRGFWNFDPAANLTVEQAANILLSALQCYTVEADGLSTGTKLAASLNLEHMVLTEWEDPFNRPGSTWFTLDGEAVTGEYTATPLYVFGSAASWCEILVALGFSLDDPANDQHIPKYFRNSMDGGQLSEKFWKHHNGENGHSDCSADFTGGQDATLEIYEIADYEYRNVCMNTFLAVSDPYEGLVIYGFERAKYGPYTDENRPNTGVYIAHHYWNAYGLGNGYEIVGPATVIKGTLTEGNVLKTVIDGKEYENGQSYGFNKKLTTAPVNAGKEFYFYLDRYGYMLGCSEEPIE